jgi:hypothetical protein
VARERGGERRQGDEPPGGVHPPVGLAPATGNRTINKRAGQCDVPNLIHACQKQLIHTSKEESSTGPEFTFASGMRIDTADTEARPAGPYEHSGRLGMEPEGPRRCRPRPGATSLGSRRATPREHQPPVQVARAESALPVACAGPSDSRQATADGRLDAPSPRARSTPAGGSLSGCTAAGRKSTASACRGRYS